MSGGDDDGGGGIWLISYCDMVTLLTTCFILVFTFLWSDKGKMGRNPPNPDGINPGPRGSGIAGVARMKGPDRDSVLFWIPRRTDPLVPYGPETPLQYMTPPEKAGEEVFRSMEVAKLGTLKDSYALRVPVRLLFDAKGQLSESGKHFLDVMARNVGPLPYDILFQVDDPRDLTNAVQLGAYLGDLGIPPVRVGLGVREASKPGSGSLWVTYVRKRA